MVQADPSNSTTAPVSNLPLPSRRAALAALTGGAVLAAGAAFPAVALGADHPDRALLDLGQHYDAALAVENRAFVVWSDELEALEAALRAAKPSALKIREEDRTLFPNSDTRRRFAAPPKRANAAKNFDEDDVEIFREGPRTRAVYHIVNKATGIKTEVAARPPGIDFDEATCELHGSSVPYPEAQSRAEEIIAAWDRYNEASERLRDASASETAEDAYYDAVEKRQAIGDVIASTRATTLTGLKIRARIVAGIRTDDDGECDEFEPTSVDEKMVAAILRDLIAMSTSV